jgi:hypothetical protein
MICGTLLSGGHDLHNHEEHAPPEPTRITALALSTSISTTAGALLTSDGVLFVPGARGAVMPGEIGGTPLDIPRQE